MSEKDLGQFFDTLTDNYSETIERCFPRYREMLWALLDYLPHKQDVRSVLELGCGTGNLSALLHQTFPNATLTLVDISAESLEACGSRLGSADCFVLRQEDFRDLQNEPGSLDLIISSISIHHLDSSAKQRLFQSCHAWLKAGGILSFADQCAGVTDELSERHRQNWKELTFKAGSTSDDWEMWMQHQAEHDHHDTLQEHLDWLKGAGFSDVDCVWRYLLWSVIQGRK